MDGDLAGNSVATHPAHLAHHFETLPQQIEAGKLGMWIFLGTEILLFTGLFCIYAVYRGTHPEIFAYGHQFLSVGWGATNTAVLILSSFTMALAVRAAQCSQRRALVIFLALTLLGGCGFLGIKLVEYSHKFRENLVWGARFYEEPPGEASATSAADNVGSVPAVGPTKVKSVGSNPATAQSLGTSPASGPTTQATERWDVPAPASGPAGLKRYVPPQLPAGARHTGPIDPRRDPQRPENVHQFFAIYFCMTGLHGLHVLAGMAMLAWLLARAVRGDFTRRITRRSISAGCTGTWWT